jgi:hypothetical protein
MHPIWDWDGSKVTSLSAQIDDCPMAFPLLNVANREPGEFVPAESTSEKNSKQRPVPFTFDPLVVWCLPERLSLVGA